MECVVFGARAGVAAAKDVEDVALVNESAVASAVESVRDRISKLESNSGDVDQYGMRKQLQKVMWEKVGVFRKSPDLGEAVKEITELREKYGDIRYKQSSKIFDRALVDTLVLEGVLEVATVIARGANLREESRGSHYRLDYNMRDDENWLKHTVAYYEEDGPRFEYKPVTITDWPVKEREY